ncbi:BON domain-containing protein [uncultured Chitinophaga sp.]|uniref:BON domain-containing protein n=1 Tax=uncultured Chitinophaga sp. TaxID=339340 RepID=UPI0025FB7AC2|nr:BON domain-containing protein [uncultured Chitinophaga sp.]
MKTDIKLQEDVMEQLRWEPSLNSAEIGVAATNGVITLSGKVDSYYKKIIAEKVVRRVSGVKAVAEDIVVGLSPFDQKTDTDLAESVVHTFKWDNAVPDEKISVKVEDGVVSLYGEVMFEYQRTAAQNDVQKLVGVVRVNNFLTVEKQPTPYDVKRKIMAAFHRSATIDANRISAEVSGNKVTLTGMVRSLAEADDAIDAAWAAPGIEAVENLLTLEEGELVYQ